MELTNAYVEKWLRDYMSDPEKNALKELPGPLMGMDGLRQLLKAAAIRK